MYTKPRLSFPITSNDQHRFPCQPAFFLSSYNDLHEFIHVFTFYFSVITVNEPLESRQSNKYVSILFSIKLYGLIESTVMHVYVEPV